MRTVLITGGSSGLGAALALEYARAGAHVAFNGRDAGRVEAVAAAIRAAGGTASGAVLDVTDTPALSAWIAGHAPDLAIANAGIAAGRGPRGEDAGAAAPILAVNVSAAVETVRAVLPGMIARGRGQVALMASLAAYRGLPGAATYSASKAFLRVWAQGLRAQMAPLGVRVSSICPGFVATPMTANNRWMPGLMDAERAARIIVAGLARDRAAIAFPWFLRAALRLVDLAPAALSDRIAARFAPAPEDTREGWG